MAADFYIFNIFVVTIVFFINSPIITHFIRTKFVNLLFLCHNFCRTHMKIKCIHIHHWQIKLFLINYIFCAVMLTLILNPAKSANHISFHA